MNSTEPGRGPDVRPLTLPKGNGRRDKALRERLVVEAEETRQRLRREFLERDARRRAA
jgi:hypothetical protein